MNGKGNDALSRYFSLSYAAWLTMPRVMLEGMPDEWQGKLAELLYEWKEMYPNQPEIGTTVRITDMSGKLIKTPKWLLNYRHPDLEQLKKIKGIKDE